MPEALQLPPVAQAVLAITAVALAVVRLLTASRPFWAWEKVPVWVQKALPALLMAIAALPTAIEHARSWLDIVVGFVVTGAMWFTASRGDKRPPEDKDGGPRIARLNSDPKVDVPAPWVDVDTKAPPSLPGVSRFIAVGWMLVACTLLGGCGLFTAQSTKSAQDLAHDLCVLHYGKAKPALSLEDLARTYCKDIDPWLDAIVVAEKVGATKAAAKP